MKINEKKVQERLQGVPDAKRSHIYNATLIIEFLDQNFVPTRKFLPELYKGKPGMSIDSKDFFEASREHPMQLSHLYDLYKRWRDVKDYTSEVETRFTFGLIIRNLRLYKNGWEFRVYRVGSAQIWHVGPAALVKDLPEVSRRKVEPADIERGTVEADPLMPPDTFVEARKWEVAEFVPDE